MCSFILFRLFIVCVSCWFVACRVYACSSRVRMSVRLSIVSRSFLLSSSACFFVFLSMVCSCVSRFVACVCRLCSVSMACCFVFMDW